MDDYGTGSARARLANSLVLGMIQALSEASQAPPDDAPTVRLGDVVLGLGAVAVGTTRRVSETLGLALRPVASVLAPPAALTAAPARLLGGLARRGRAERAETAVRLEDLGRRVGPRVLDRLLGLVDVTDLVRDHVDLDTLAADLDLDALVARVDIDAILERVDVDAIADRLDVDAVAAKIALDAILDRVDVDAVVARVDVAAILDRVDVDAIVARVDVPAILDRVDIDAVAARLDLDAVVARLDLVALAELVIEGVDLPGIIQSSTGSMASEATREVRRQGIDADERVAHVIDRILRRQERHPGAPPGEPLLWGEEPAPAPAAASADEEHRRQVPPSGGYGLAH